MHDSEAAFSNCFIQVQKYARVAVPSARLLNQIDYPSVMLIKSHYGSVEIFGFRRASVVEALEQVDNLYTKKASPIGSILAKIIKGDVEIVASHLLDLFNKSVDWTETFFLMR